MATKIEWTDETWNPIRGCSRVSEGCRNCYAEKIAYRFSDAGRPYHGLVGIGGKWNGKIKFVEDHLLDPLRWKKPRRIFVNSMSDLFHENVTDEMRDRIFAVMALCPQHTFQVLTKRPERMLEYLGAPDRQKLVARACIDPENDYPIHDGYFHCDEPGNLNLYEVFWKNCRLYFKDEEDVIREAHDEGRWMQFVAADFHWPLPNVWPGVSVEDQKTADERIPLLLQTPAAVRFISAEPLLGSVDLHNLDAHSLSRAQGHVPTHDELEEPWKYDCLTAGDIYWGGSGGISDGPEHAALDWVIVGGESGPDARPMHPDWARSLRDQCVAAGVPFFFKQWGEWLPAMSDGVNTLNCSDEPVRVGKKAAGHLLDGKEWHEFPESGR